MLDQTSLLIFTLGQTEAWVHRRDGTVYPTAPGSIAGAYNAKLHDFQNFSCAEIQEDFLALRALLKQRNPEMRFILTVSPVPLAATASTEHVLAATTYSKSVLRTAAGQLAMSHPDIDYFPSYEIIAAAPCRGVFYEADMRAVTPAGVDAAMRPFFDQHGNA